MLVDCVQDYAIFRLDPNGVITSWNRGAQRIKGYSATEAIGQHFSMVEAVLALALILREHRVTALADTDQLPVTVRDYLPKF